MSNFDFLIDHCYRLPSGSIVKLRGLEPKGDGWTCDYVTGKPGKPQQVSLSSAFLRKYAKPLHD